MRDDFMRFLIIVSALLFAACGEISEVSEAKLEPQSSEIVKTMDADRLAALIKNFDDDAEIGTNRIAFQLRERDLLVVFDKAADRMRIMTPIMQAAAVPAEIHERMLQANFDAVLDSRYAIANEIVWSVFIHRMSTLTESDFLSAVAQTYTGAETFGTSYTSGAMVFGGGDSNSLHEELLEELKKRPTKENTGI